jgi:ribosomal protein S27E
VPSECFNSQRFGHYISCHVCGRTILHSHPTRSSFIHIYRVSMCRVRSLELLPL